MHFYGWKMGLKTGMYYLRSKPAANAIQFTVNKLALDNKENASAENDAKKPKFERQMSADQQKAAALCSLLNREECDMCGS